MSPRQRFSDRQARLSSRELARILIRLVSEWDRRGGRSPADGSRPLRLTDHPERDDYACWHPDGRRRVIVSERDGEFDLYLLDFS